MKTVKSAMLVMVVASMVVTTVHAKTYPWLQGRPSTPAQPGTVYDRCHAPCCRFAEGGEG